MTDRTATNVRAAVAEISKRAALLALAFAASVAGACESPPPGGADVVLPGDPELNLASTEPESPQAGEAIRSWQSAPAYDGARTDIAWIAYPGQSRIEVHHGLGRAPQGVLVYIAFGPDGQNAALAAGDLALLRAVDAEQVTFANGTHGNYYARVVVF